jgi:hypothetical protein
LSIREFIIRALLFIGVAEPMPRGMGARAAGAYLLRSMAKAAAFLTACAAVFAVARATGALFPRGWSLAATYVVIGLCCLPLHLFYRRVNLSVRRYRAGECVYCGYSLFANESGICPECGRPAPEPLKVEAEEAPPVPRSPWEWVIISAALLVVAAALVVFGYVFYRAWRMT